MQNKGLSQAGTNYTSNTGSILRIPERHLSYMYLDLVSLSEADWYSVVSNATENKPF